MTRQAHWVLGTTTAERVGNSFRLQAVPLSNDQTQKLADEAAWCVRAGVQILSFGQVDPSKEEEEDNDDDGVDDPWRVWSKHGLYRDTTFPRSFSDAAAERRGVFAEPEQLTFVLPDTVKEQPHVD